jgi:hypothetical protein
MTGPESVPIGPVASADATALVLDALVSHGIDAKLEGGWITVKGSAATLRARAHAGPPQPGGVVARFDAEVGLPDGRLLVDTFGASGKDAREATIQCLGKFVMGSLHPILGAFFGHREHQEIERWCVGGHDFDALRGSILAQTGGAAPPPGLEKLSPLVRAAAEARGSVSKGAHWLKVFYAQAAKKTETVEAYWDNEPWPELTQSLRAFEWPTVEGHFVARFFLALAPVPPEEPSGPDYRTIERALDLLVDTCSKDKALNDQAVIEKLVAAEVAPALAERVVTFGPFGFSAVLLNGCKLTPDYQVMGSRNELVATRRFMDEPVFVAARHVAVSLTGDAASKDRFFAVASRCDRVSAANQALARGKKLEEVTFEPPVVFLREPVSGPASERPLDPAPRPWWKKLLS